MKSFLRIGLVLATVVVMAGCATMRPIPPATLHTTPPPVAADGIAEPDYVPPEPPAGAPAPGHDAQLIQRGTGVFIDPKAAGKAPAPKAPAGDVSFNFEGESLHAVIKAILGDILQENYVIAPGVQGNVTFSTAKPLAADQALSILEMLLRWNNATLVWENGRYTILPINQAVPGNLTPRTGPVANARGYEVRAVPLKYISATEMEKVLKPYAKPDAVISVDPMRNMLVLGGTRAELENYLQTIDVFDVDWLAGMSIGVFPLMQAEAGKVVPELEKIFGEGSNTPLAGMFRFLPLEGSNSVIVITPQPKYLAKVEEWIGKIDLGGGEAGQRLYVYDVKNVKAQDLADTLNDIFGGGGGSGGSAARRSGDVAPGLEPVEIKSVSSASNRVGQPLQTGGDNDRGGANGSGRPGGGNGAGVVVETGPGGAVVDGAGGISIGSTEQIGISAVEENNALLIRATAGQWESIRRVVERLDQIPLQVMIEAQIVQVTLNDQLKYGVRWFFDNAVGSAQTELFGEDEVGLPESALAISRARESLASYSGVIGASTQWSFIGQNVGSIVELLDSVGHTTVLSAPTMVVLNNKEAAITSGRSVPVTSTTINTGAGSNNAYQSSQYLQTGITLNVTPRVNPGGLVFLEIEAEDSTADTSVTTGNPPINNRTITTEVAVQSGQTVVLGGLIKQTDADGSRGLPGLHRIPVIGALFGGKNRSTDREELLVMITPRVIRDPSEARRITEEYKAQFRGLQPLLAPTAAAPAEEP